MCRLGHKNDQPNEKVAVKTLLRDHPNFDPTALKHEISIMQAINHPRCINLIEVREDEAAVHLVEELASGGAALYLREITTSLFRVRFYVFALLHRSTCLCSGVFVARALCPHNAISSVHSIVR